MVSIAEWPPRENEVTLEYEPELRQQWIDRGGLGREWCKQYESNLIGVCELDFSNAEHQTSGHFGEWFAAKDYAEKGYRVLLPKYTHRKRPERVAETKRVIGPAGFDFLTCKRELPDKRGLRRVLRKPPKPDLLVYNTGEFFFAEVKRDLDRLFPAQRAFFPMIERELHCTVFLVHVREKYNHYPTVGRLQAK